MTLAYSADTSFGVELTPDFSCSLGNAFAPSIQDIKYAMQYAPPGEVLGTIHYDCGIIYIMGTGTYAAITSLNERFTGNWRPTISKHPAPRFQREPVANTTRMAPNGKQLTIEVTYRNRHGVLETVILSYSQVKDALGLYGIARCPHVEEEIYLHSNGVVTRADFTVGEWNYK